MDKRKNPAAWIARTAVLLGLALLFQSLRIILPVMAAVNLGPFNLSVLIIGSLVNLTLCVAAGYVGFWSGAAISVLTPVVAFFQGHIPAALPVLIPVVAAGNLAIVTIFWLFCRKARFNGSMYVGTVAGTALKFGVMWALLTYAVLPFLGIFIGDAAKATAMATALTFSFTWSQLITGIIGGVLAALIIPAIRRGRGEREPKKEQEKK